jgi:cation transport ATPase
VLVAACPCALGLATSIVVTLGVMRAAKAGALVRSSETLENLSRIRHIIFDKTGTLTGPEDRLRPEARKTIEQLEASGISTALISGDHEEPTHRAAEASGIETFLFRKNPIEKQEALAEARMRYRGLVAMVGDGVNDAPALASADVGITVRGGADLAKEAGHVVPLGDDLTRIPWLVDLARTARRIIAQNLAWAFGYNALAMGLAFFGYIHPLIAAIAMLLSSSFVLGNSMRVRRIPER